MLIHKRGDTFDYTAVIPSSFADGYFVGWTVTSQVRTDFQQNLLADIDCTWIDPVTTRTLSLKKMSTSNWTIGDADMDIQFVRNSDGYTLSTGTIAIQVVRDITQPDGVP